MKHDAISRLADFFLSLAKEELPEDSNNLKVILKNLEKLDNYNSRKAYAEKNLKRLSSGSSRLVYLTPNDTVVKLAKNDKGIDQNKAESNPKMKSKLINKILNKAKNHSWIEVPLLEKISEKEFKEMTGVEFKDFGDCLRFGLKSLSDHSSAKKPKCFDEVEGSKIYKELQSLGKRFKLLPGDLVRISSWGRQGKLPVLIDAGLTKEVYQEHYDSSGDSSDSSS